MPSDDELRRVAEDVRALARSLGKDIRAAFERAHPDDDRPTGRDGAEGRLTAREDLGAAGRAAREEWRKAERAIREAAREHRHRHDDGFGPGGPPRWDNWGNQRYRDKVRVKAERKQHASKPVPVPVPVAPVRHRHDGTTLIGLLAVVFGLAWLATGTHLASVSTEAVLAIALMVVGATTVVTARTDWALSGRAWPIVAGVAAVVALLAISAAPGLPVGFRHLRIGSRRVTPTAWGQVPASIHGGIGQTIVDLTRLPVPLLAARSLAIDDAAGRIDIELPDIPVQGMVHVQAGRILLEGVASAGVGRSISLALNPLASGAPLTLNVQGGFGEVLVNQGPVASTAVPTPTPPSTPVGP